MMRDRDDDLRARCADGLFRRKRGWSILFLVAVVSVVAVVLAVIFSSRNDGAAATSQTPSSAAAVTVNGPTNPSSTSAPSSQQQLRPSPTLPGGDGSVVVSPAPAPPSTTKPTLSSPPTVDLDGNETDGTTAPSFGPSALSPALAFTAFGSFDLLEAVPHDDGAYTQGLEVISHAKLGLARNSSNSSSSSNSNVTSSYFLESTGLYGSSSIRLVELATGTVYHQLDMDESYFGEGCTYYMHETTAVGRTVLRVVQITWQSGTGFVYETSLDDPPANLVQVGSFAIETVSGEGWGISYLPQRDQFVVSDGTEFLHFWELRDRVDESGGGGYTFVFAWVDTISVTSRLSSSDEWAPVVRVNELEWDPLNYDGTTILANIWLEDHIVRIRLSDGKVTHQYDLSSLDRPSDADVLNGIAAVLDSSSTSGPTPTPSSTKNQFWVTGKLWPQIYRIRLTD